MRTAAQFPALMSLRRSRPSIGPEVGAISFFSRLHKFASIASPERPLMCSHRMAAPVACPATTAPQKAEHILLLDPIEANILRISLQKEHVIDQKIRELHAQLLRAYAEKYLGQTELEKRLKQLNDLRVAFHRMAAQYPTIVSPGVVQTIPPGESIDPAVSVVLEQPHNSPAQPKKASWLSWCLIS